jgi:hypothetical protein
MNLNPEHLQMTMTDQDWLMDCGIEVQQSGGLVDFSSTPTPEQQADKSKPIVSALTPCQDKVELKADDWVDPLDKKEHVPAKDPRYQWDPEKFEAERKARNASSAKFRLNAKRLFLTYPQCPAPKDHLKLRLHEVLGTQGIDRLIIGQE